MTRFSRAVSTTSTDKVSRPLIVKVLYVASFLFIVLLFSFSCNGQGASQSAPNQLIQKGELHTIPGCGNSGCYATNEICVNVPTGSTSLSTANYYDSFSGWAAFPTSGRLPPASVRHTLSIRITLPDSFPSMSFTFRKMPK
jgi:hypothetical protein